MKDLLILTFLAFLVGCSSPEGKAAALMETARFEETQGNKSSANEIKKMIVEKFPRTPTADQAKKELEKGLAPKPAVDDTSFF